MIEITNSDEVAELHIQALGQQNQTEEPEPHATLWAALVQGAVTGSWCLVTRDTLGTDQAFRFKSATEAMDALQALQEYFRTWLEQAHTS